MTFHIHQYPVRSIFSNILCIPYSVLSCAAHTEYIEVKSHPSVKVHRGYEIGDTITVVFSPWFTSGAFGCFTLSDTATGPMSWEQTNGEDNCNEDNDYCRDINANRYFAAGTKASLTSCSDNGNLGEQRGGVGLVLQAARDLEARV